jgi:putative transposase
MSLKMEFVERASKRGVRIAPLCREFGISRETGYKWLNRFKRDGYSGLEEKSRRPHSAPLSAAEDVVLAVLKAREAHPRWGSKKLELLLKKSIRGKAPSRSTIARILRRFGQVRRRRRRPMLNVVEKAPRVPANAPNDVWTVDFKGWWRAGDGKRCEPLTIRDAFSRYVLEVALLESTAVASSRKVFERVFRKYGLPKVIHCDNGAPFINVRARGGLTRLSAWWIALGIQVVRSRPGCPQDNGGHERMHSDLRADVQLNPSETLEKEQRACDRWRQEFNHVRPHEALKGKTPAEVYKRSEIKHTTPLPYFYPVGWIVRNASKYIGTISIDDEKYRTSRALAGYPVALEPLGGLKHRLWFRNVNLGELELCPRNEVIDEVAEQFSKSPLTYRRAQTHVLAGRR